MTEAKKNTGPSAGGPLKTGASLVPVYVKCPHCHKELMDMDVSLDSLPAIKLIVKLHGKKGVLWLSAQYGSFVSIDEKSLCKKGDVADMFCPICSRELKPAGNCNACEAPMYALDLTSGGIIEFCSRKGCTNHHLEFKEIEDLALFYDKLHLDFSPAP